MTSLAFDYERPATVAAAMDLLAEPGSIVLAGGQSLVPLLNRRAVTPKRVVDITRISELREIALDGDVLRIGAAVRLAEIEKSPVLKHFPLLAEVIASTASPPIRNRATLVGNLVRANAMSELTVACVALDASLVIGSQTATRSVPAGAFFLGHHASAVGAGEIVLRVELPRSSAAFVGSTFSEISNRAGAPPIVCVAVCLDVDRGCLITAARIVAGGIAARPMRCLKTEAALVGKPCADAAQYVVAEDIPPAAELHNASYAADVLPVVIKRAVTRACAGIKP
ncbi:FAD binding domain-containing protein [Bradyrhizobium cenepequi]